MNRREMAGAAVAIFAMTIFVTWPQALHMGSSVAAHQDPEFSIWRLAWIAHALVSDPRRLFSANIFYPAPGTLTYSDATLFEGFIAAPLFWAHVSPFLIYNLLLLGGFAASGVAVFVLARHLTGAFLPALIAAAVFTMAPYRIEHFMHLELQWAMWIPLTFFALHRVLETAGAQRRRYGLLTGLCLWLQVVSCVYYGVFLTMAVGMFLLVMAIWRPREVVAAAPALILGGVLLAFLTAPYLWAYVRTAQAMGLRDITEIATYSGRLSSYFAAPGQNWLRGTTVLAPEVNLFLGWTAMALALAALAHRSRSVTVTYVAIASFSVVASLGMNTPVYARFVRAIPGLQGLRAPSRFSIVVCCAVAVLAAFGAQVVFEKLRSRLTRWHAMVLPALLLLLCVEYANTGMNLMDLSRWAAAQPTVYRAMSSAGPGAVAELPMPTPDTLPGQDTDYELFSLEHWHPLVNGYSGYYPPAYVRTLALMRSFPDEASIERLQALGVRYVIVHCAFFKTQDSCGRLLSRMGARSELSPYGKFTDAEGPAYLFVLKQ